jgi:protocatechuate 3,4-dioxygenase beta subunit
MLLTKLKTSAVALLATASIGLTAGGLLYHTQASQPAVTQTNPEPKSQVQPKPVAKSEALPEKEPADDSVAVVGKVVDEQGAPVSGINVRLLASLKYGGNTITDPQGNFRFALPERREYTKLLWAEDADGRRQGMLHFERLQDAKGLRITLKPARTATVHVIDARGQPVSGARVVLFEASVKMLLTQDTHADGMTTLRYPADATIGQLSAFKSGIGFDYISTLSAKQSLERKPLPEDITLKLTGARTVRVKAVDSANRPVAGVPICPWYIQLSGKPENVNLSACDAVTVTTDTRGEAVFDWLPFDFDLGFSFLNKSPGYSYTEPIVIKQEAPVKELTMHLLRRSRISGKVSLPDGRPAAGIAVEASAAGGDYMGQELTRSDGSYETLVNSEKAYIVTVVDDRWAAPSYVCVVREDKPVNAIDFQLAEGTIVRGTVTVGADRHPAANAYLVFTMDAGEIPAELKIPGDRVYRRMSYDRWTTTDAEGKYRICFGPGIYEMRTRGSPVPSQSPRTIIVDRAREIVFDYHLAQLEIARLLGKVVDSDGHPVARATIQGIYQGDGIGRPDIEAETAADGTFQVERALVPTVVCARTADGTRAGVAHLDAKQVVVTLPVRPLAEAQGRLLSAQGEIVAGGRVRYGVHVYVDEKANSAFQIAFGGVATSGADGRYTLKGLLLGEEYHVDFEVAEHEPSRPLTILKPAKAEIINLGDTPIPKS